MLPPYGRRPQIGSPEVSPPDGGPRSRFTHPLARVRWVSRRLLPFFGGRARLTALAASGVGAGLAEAGVLALIANVAAAMVDGGHSLHAELGPVTPHLGVGAALVAAAGLAVMRLALQLVTAWLPARLSADMQARLARDLFDAFGRASWSEQAEQREGHLQELMTNQISQAADLNVYVTTALASGSMLVGLLGAAFVLSPVVALIMLVGAVGITGVLAPLRRYGRAAAGQLSQANMGQAEGVSESLRLAEETRVFGAEQAYQGRLAELIARVRGRSLRFRFTYGLAQSLHQFALIMLIVGGLGGLYLFGTTRLASLGAVVLMLVRAGTYGQQVQVAYLASEQLMPYLDRLETATARYASSALVDSNHPLPTLRTLAFKEVGYAYRRGTPALVDVSFQVQAGEAIGIVGATGAGKSTLIQLLLRLRDPTVGEYLIDNVRAGVFSRSDWQHRVAYVSQEPRVFRGTVAENIAFFRDLDAAAIERAGQLAHIHNEIMAMPAGYNTIIGQQADAVSGGQRQRICLARALVGNPALLVLDEPTSALDLASETAVRASLVELRGRVTMFIASHRPSVLELCDRLMVLDEGRLIAFAPAPELHATNPFYRRVLALADDPA